MSNKKHEHSNQWWLVYSALVAAERADHGVTNEAVYVGVFHRAANLADLAVRVAEEHEKGKRS